MSGGVREREALISELSERKLRQAGRVRAICRDEIRPERERERERIVPPLTAGVLFATHSRLLGVFYAVTLISRPFSSSMLVTELILPLHFTFLS